MCENCIVDASIFIFFVSFVYPNAHRTLCVWCFSVVCFKGTRWMPWHIKPMKDV